MSGLVEVIYILQSENLIKIIGDKIENELEHS